MQCYPDNTVAHYTSKLANPIEVEGDWEVGLAEVSFPSTIENILPDRCYYDIYFEDVFTRRGVLPPGTHKRVQCTQSHQCYAQRRAQSCQPASVDSRVFLQAL